MWILPFRRISNGLNGLNLNCIEGMSLIKSKVEIPCLFNTMFYVIIYFVHFPGMPSSILRTIFSLCIRDRWSNGIYWNLGRPMPRAVHRFHPCLYSYTYTSVYIYIYYIYICHTHTRACVFEYIYMHKGALWKHYKLQEY